MRIALKTHGLILSFVGSALFLVRAPVGARAEPVKLARTARLDLSADLHVGALEAGKVVDGNGAIVRMSWLPVSAQLRAYSVSVPVTHLGWRSLAVRFTPRHNGKVTLTLMGPWEEASKGVIYRQEILWDDLRAEGAELAAGGFEWQSGLPVSGWQSGGGRVLHQTPDAAAVEGTHYAQTWHNQTLFAALDVTGGRPVTIRLYARAVWPADWKEMKRIVSRSTPAHRAARRFLRGANLGNDLEVPPGQNWNVRHSADDLRLIRAEGFDHVRIPVGWHHYTGAGPSFSLRPEIFTRVDELTNAGLGAGLGVIVNIHHFDEFTSDPRGQTGRFIAIWRQIAAHFARSPEGLAFELLNEPKDAATTEVINPIFAQAIQAIRQIDRDRTIFVGPGAWNSVAELDKLQLGENESNVIVTVHNYEPFYFTHQGADWAGPDTKVTGIRFPGPPKEPLTPDPKLRLNPWVLDWVKAYNAEARATNPCSKRAFQQAIDEAREWSEYYGRPIHFGEFGCFTTADAASRARYYRAFREAAERAKVGWAIWDWKAGFRYWDEKTGRPEPGMHEALFGR